MEFEQGEALNIMSLIITTAGVVNTGVVFRVSFPRVIIEVQQTLVKYIMNNRPLLELEYGIEDSIRPRLNEYAKTCFVHFG